MLHTCFAGGGLLFMCMNIVALLTFSALIEVNIEYKDCMLCNKVHKCFEIHC